MPNYSCRGVIAGAVECEGAVQFNLLSHAAAMLLQLCRFQYNAFKHSSSSKHSLSGHSHALGVNGS